MQGFGRSAWYVGQDEEDPRASALFTSLSNDFCRLAELFTGRHQGSAVAQRPTVILGIGQLDRVRIQASRDFDQLRNRPRGYVGEERNSVSAPFPALWCWRTYLELSRKARRFRRSGRTPLAWHLVARPGRFAGRASPGARDDQGQAEGQLSPDAGRGRRRQPLRRSLRDQCACLVLPPVRPT